MLAWCGQAGSPVWRGMPGDADGMHRVMRRVTGGEKTRLISLPVTPSVLVIDGRFQVPRAPRAPHAPRAHAPRFPLPPEGDHA